MNWYLTLDIDTRIAVKEAFVLLLGVSFESLGKLFSMRERLNLFYDKLKIEGFEV